MKKKAAQTLTFAKNIPEQMSASKFTIEETRIPAEAMASEAGFRKAIFSALSRKEQPEDQILVLRQSIDARSRNVMLQVKLAVGPDALQANPLSYDPQHLPYVAHKDPVIVVGSGPAGLFAALELIEAGLKPIVLERGQDVKARRRDLADLNKADRVNPESNYCFGEGGAGTYSDGKLYTRSNKRGDIRKVLEIFVKHGANPQILVESHPHIGTNKLPPVVQALRETIIAHGGEVHFNTKVEALLMRSGRVTGVELRGGQALLANAVILATGHSARDIFEMLWRQKVAIQAKPFALGFRIEHPQELINQIQYKSHAQKPWLPAASYSLVHQANTHMGVRGVFSFCMCPGGFIVPAMTASNELVVNGMSPSRRNSRFANSGMVVSVQEEDFKPFERKGPLAGLYFQKSIEQKAASFLPGRLAAPAQRLTDFLNNRLSDSFPDCSYQPGLVSAPLQEVVPPYFAQALKSGFADFGKKMKGYLTEEAVLLGVESRTSSPVKIPRLAETGMHTEISGLFPCGEGAGFAGGIMSAALDGIFIARMVDQFLN